MPLRALVLVCTLKGSPAPSSCWQLGQEVLEQLGSFAANAVHPARLLQSDGYPSA